MAACTGTPMGFGRPWCLVNLLCRCIADAQPHPPALQMLPKALERWWLCLFLSDLAETSPLQKNIQVSDQAVLVR